MSDTHVDEDGWETVYQSPPAVDPAVGVTYDYQPPDMDRFPFWSRSKVRFTVERVEDYGEAVDTTGYRWYFSVDRRRFTRVKP